MPYSLDGLNVVYTHQPATDNTDLLSGAPPTDLSLEIWDRLPFNLEEGQEQLSEEKRNTEKSKDGQEQDHNVGQGQAFSGFEGSHMWGQQAPQTSNQTTLPFAPDLTGNDALQLLLSTLLQQQQQATPQLANLSIAQLMAHQQALGLAPNFLTAPSLGPASAPAAQTSSVRRSAPEDSVAPPPAKRARSRKSSVSVSSPDTDSAASPESSSANITTPLSAAEDKRRRNTAASARFRQKKKEREAALEARAKELQDQVTGLEKECETLRRENNWLKGLVVGVTGAGASQNTTN